MAAALRKRSSEWTRGLKSQGQQLQQRRADQCEGELAKTQTISIWLPRTAWPQSLRNLLSGCGCVWESIKCIYWHLINWYAVSPWEKVIKSLTCSCAWTYKYSKCNLCVCKSLERIHTKTQEHVMRWALANQWQGINWGYERIIFPPNVGRRLQFPVFCLSHLNLAFVCPHFPLVFLKWGFVWLDQPSILIIGGGSVSHKI